jgi:hypothetical protein
MSARLSSIFLGALALAVVVAGCAEARSTTPELVSTPTATFGGTVPAFAGPYAQEFATAYTSSTTDFQRGILEDGVIEKSELSEAQKRWVTCMKARGFSASVSYGEPGSYVVKQRRGYNQDTAGDIVTQCGAGTTDYVESLYVQVNQNPTNEDYASLMVDCLRRSGLVGGEYSRARYEQESKTGDYSFDTNDRRFDRCNLDPQASG